MDFFERQNHARTLTRVLVVYLILAVLAIVAAVDLLSLGAYSVFRNAPVPSRHYVYSDGGDRTSAEMGNAEAVTMVLVASVVTVLVIGGASAYQFSALSGGGRAVATLLGGRLVAPNTTDVGERRLMDVVTEMAIASGIPVPPVYVMADEHGINACASGFSSRDGVIAVTAGALKYLTRDELQGVVAHEFSHLLNGDTRLDLRLICLLHGILFLTIIGFALMQAIRFAGMSGGSRRSSGAGVAAAIFVFGALLTGIGYVGVFFARLIQAAVSRQREFLADASAVQFTRNPAGLVGALKKIGGFSSQMNSPNAIGAAHVFFSNALGQPVTNLLATHPPLVARILALDPTFDGKFQPFHEVRPALQDARSSMPPVSGFGGVRIGGRTSVDVGRPQLAHAQYAAVLLASLPQDLRTVAADPMSSRALVYAMILSDDPALRDGQIDFLKRQGDQVALGETLRYAQNVSQLGPAVRLALVNLSIPALHHLSDAQLAAFLSAVQGLIDAGGPESIFEYALSKIVTQRLRPAGAAAGKAPISYYAIKPLLPDTVTILAGLAHAGGEGDKAEAAFAAGMAALDPTWSGPCPPAPGISEIDAALDRLRASSPPIRARLIDACGRCIAADGVVVEDEAELLRAVCLTLDCPLPPLLQSSNGSAGA